MCKHRVDLALEADCKQPNTGAGSKLRLNLGHRDSQEQEQERAEALVAEGVGGY